MHAYMKRIYTHTDRFQGEKLHTDRFQGEKLQLFHTCYSYTQNQIADNYAYKTLIYTY